jgi:hypothetical protein
VNDAKSGRKWVYQVRARRVMNVGRFLKLKWTHEATVQKNYFAKSPTTTYLNENYTDKGPRMKKTSLKFSKDINVNVPGVPNYIIVDTRPVPVSSFSESELRAIGKAWIENLIERSKEQNSDDTDEK